MGRALATREADSVLQSRLRGCALAETRATVRVARALPGSQPARRSRRYATTGRRRAGPRTKEIRATAAHQEGRCHAAAHSKKGARMAATVDASFFDCVIERRGTDSSKWSQEGNKAKFGRADVLPFWVADMDFRTVPEVTEALVHRAEHGIFGYRAGNAHNEAFAGWVQRHYGWTIDPARVVNTVGVVPALRFAVQAFTQPGDKVMIQEPVYYPFARSIKLNGRVPVSNDLVLTDGVYGIDFEDFERIASDPDVTMFIMCSPHNPVGRVWTPDELKRMADICIAHDVQLVVDEIHADLTMPGVTHTPLASLGEIYAQHTVTCMAPSKTFNLAGLQLCNIVIPNERLHRLFENCLRRVGLEGKVNLFAVLASQIAYEQGDAWLEALRAYLGDNLAFARSYLAEHLPQVKLYDHQGTYLLWMDFRAFGLESEELERVCFQEAGVALDAGTWFGPTGAGFMRLNFGCPRSMLEQGLKQLADAFAKLPARA